MHVRSGSKSMGRTCRNQMSDMDFDDSNRDSRDLSSTSYFRNLKSLSGEKLQKPPFARPSEPENSVARNTQTVLPTRNIASHDSIELLNTRNASRSVQRRQTVDAMQRVFTMVEEEGEKENAPCIKDSASLGEVQLESPPIIGKSQHLKSSKNRNPDNSRNSIDNANISGSFTPKKLRLEETQDDAKEGSADRIKVYVRLRPMSRKEKVAGARCCVRELNRREVYLTEMASECDYLRLKRLKGRYFVFDGAFPGDASQKEVYLCSAAQLVEGVLSGQNSSMFCYGATGAGKTFTMLGTVEEPGVMILAIKDLFLKLRQRSVDQNYTVLLSYMEVYNETVRDLISPGRTLVIREDMKQGIVVAGLTQSRVSSEDEVMALLHQGNQNRTTESTRVNETSSRSHAILQVMVEYSSFVDSLLVTRSGKLSLIDLAGSERALATDQRTMRSVEGANINRSLLALSSCISALVEGKKHIPFRNSKLTQLLKDSLGGACQTAMIANVSPSNLSFGETQNTLYWADRAKEIGIKSCMANEAPQVAGLSNEHLHLVMQLQKENQQLRVQVAQLQQKVLALESKMMAATLVCECSSKVTSPLAKSGGRLIQKENIGSSGIDAVSSDKNLSPCIDDEADGVSIDFVCTSDKVDSWITSHPDHVITDVQPEMKQTNTHLRASVTPSIKRQILSSPVAPYQKLSNSCINSMLKDNFCRKRAFWDMTNSPYTKSSCRNVRSNTQVETPSMLLQPGFMRGRPSLN
ncbi:hypothetical protein KP509_33G049400 [Ceratopteris richardii]|uniref:Kinesin-like protein n=1 Tax=Ceratopteris richardii TaxID=49495 RepID=A0A8T2QQM1_CERRI|nr:hypothetical protein KP509_33G049400 [Ceratopteris richardii]KAH7285870.1 hypothetical protein KP509_33G049400 [Ceratopteris richardii]KAH7285871.1 hypothetical protein KP509_33G049400 [Ceratopteris richardii]